MVAQLTPHQHPITACAEGITTLLAGVAQIQPVYMSTDDKRDALLALTAVQRQLEELRLRVIASAGDLAAETGARDIAAWLACHTQADPAPVRADQHLAGALDTRWERVRAGLAAGTVSPEQARVIVAGLEALPDHVGPDVRARAEAQLVDYARDFKPSELRRLARHILEVVAPEIADAEEAKALEREEQQAREDCRIASRNLGNGTTRGTIIVPTDIWTRFTTYLEAFASPRKHHHSVVGEEDRIPYRRRLGQAFCALLEHLDPTNLPAHGGDATTLLVTIPLEALQSELGVGAIVGGEPLSATAVRRLACEAGIIPVVLGGDGEILDLGRTRRLASPALRKALALRDQHCRAEGCTIRARWCEAHHLKPWSEGGETNLDDLILGCSFHHHRFHDPRFTYERLPNGDIRFHRRT